MRLLLTAILSLLPSTAFGFQAVHVVTTGSGSALQTVIDSAASGDTVLVHGGSFGPISIVGKSLTLNVEPVAAAVTTGVSITGIAVDQRVVVTGLNVSSPNSGVGFNIHDCIGPVRLERVRAIGSNPQSSTDGLIVTNVNDLTGLHSAFNGGNQIPTPGPSTTPSYSPGRGLVAVNSNVTLYECEVRGGRGQDAHFINSIFNEVPASAGGTALEIDATSTLFLGRGGITGGDGGAGRAIACVHIPCGFSPTAGGDGGSGLVVAPGATARSFDLTLSGGQGGQGGTGGICCPGVPSPNAPNGAPGSMEVGTVTHLAELKVQLSAPTTIRVGQVLSLQITGNPGDLAFLVMSSQTRAVFDPLFNGSLIFGTTARRAFYGAIPPTSLVPISLPVGPLPPGVQSTNWYLQPFTRNAAGQLQIGDCRIVTVLDPAF